MEAKQENDTKIDYNNTIVDSFDDLEIKNNLLRGIYGIGYEHPSAIQQKAIKPLIDGRDLIAQAQSGMEKLLHSQSEFLKK